MGRFFSHTDQARINISGHRAPPGRGQLGGGAVKSERESLSVDEIKTKINMYNISKKLIKKLEKTNRNRKRIFGSY